MQQVKPRLNNLYKNVVFCNTVFYNTASAVCTAAGPGGQRGGKNEHTQAER